MNSFDSELVDGLNRTIARLREENAQLTALVGDRCLDSDLALEATRRERQRVAALVDEYAAENDSWHRLFVDEVKERMVRLQREVAGSAREEGR